MGDRLYEAMVDAFLTKKRDRKRIRTADRGEVRMEHLYESIVGAFLTRNHRFVCPQYVITPDSGKGEWRCLDFVVLDVEEKRIVVVEVTTSAEFADFVRDAIELHDKGREKVRKQVVAAFNAYPNIAEWPIEIHLFVREDRESDLRKRLEARKLQFKVFTLEHAFRRWKWDAAK